MKHSIAAILLLASATASTALAAPPATQPDKVIAYVVSPEAQYSDPNISNTPNKFELDEPLNLSIKLRSGDAGTPSGDEMDRFFDQLRWRLPSRPNVIINARLTAYLPLGNEALTTCTLYAWSPVKIAPEGWDNAEAKRVAIEGLQALIEQEAESARKQKQTAEQVAREIASVKRLYDEEPPLNTKGPQKYSLQRESASLQEEQMKLGIEGREKAARRVALEMGIDQERVLEANRANIDAIAKQLRTLIEAREAEILRVRKMVEANVASTSELTEAKNKLVEAQIRLAEREQGKDSNSKSGALLGRLAEELRMTVIDEMRIANQLKASQQRLEEFRTLEMQKEAQRQSVEEMKKSLPRLLRQKVLLQIESVRGL